MQLAMGISGPGGFTLKDFPRVVIIRGSVTFYAIIYIWAAHSPIRGAILSQPIGNYSAVESYNGEPGRLFLN